uniref:ACT domain-containing protein ACR n=1 Tax=Daucus carota subsp. sativus TaxID=79200 RepID=A0A165A682_DAUCS
MPIVHIDQDSDSDATMVQVSFGDRLGALIDTMKSLKDLGLDVESSERLAMGEAFGIKAPEKKLDVDIATHIHVKDDGPTRSLLSIETADRPGLLLEVIKIVADTNVTVESAEIDTEGLVAKDKFHVSYRGAALNSTLSQVLINCLRYYLRRPESDEDSY